MVAPWILATGPGTMRWVFGLAHGETGALAFLEDAFRAPRGPFSHRYARVLACGPKAGAVDPSAAPPVGLWLGYSTADRPSVERGALGSLLRHYGPLRVLRVIRRGLAAARLVHLALPEGFYLAVLAVSAEHRGRGYGRALLADALGAARRAGHRSAALWVGRENAGAIALYRQAGFAPLGECRDRTLEGLGLEAQVAMTVRL